MRRVPRRALPRAAEAVGEVWWRWEASETSWVPVTAMMETWLFSERTRSISSWGAVAVVIVRLEWDIGRLMQ